MAKLRRVGNDHMIEVFSPFTNRVQRQLVEMHAGFRCDVTAPASETGVSAATPDGRGGWTPASAANVYTDQWCTIIHEPPTEEMVPKLQGKQFAMIYMAHDLVIRMHHKIVGSNGVTYNVIGEPRIDDDDLSQSIPCAWTGPRST